MRIAERSEISTFVTMKRLIAATLIFLPFLAHAQQSITDSIFVVERVEVTAMKQGLNLRQEPLASTVVGVELAKNNQIQAMKDVQNIVPNFYIPEYGSRITSSIYVRGLGARIDQPVVGLNIDNVPYLNKNAFDTNVMDIKRMEYLRGPQSTLYGRNTMGGVVNIYTLSPMEFQGVTLGAEYSSGDTYKGRATVYTKFSDQLAASVGLYYNSTNGFYDNEYTGERCDTEREAGGRVRLQYQPSAVTSVENTFSLSVLDQGGYPYYSLDRGEISYNDPCSYNRLMVSNGLTIQKRREHSTLSSITGYQYLNDEMQLDNDFSPDDIFTLVQTTREHSLTQDVVIRSRRSSGYNHICGAFAFYKNQNMDAPVEFKEQGIESLILDSVNGVDEYYLWNSDSFDLNSNFINHTAGVALYHESSYKTSKWDFTAAIRLDYEFTMLNYHSYMNTGCVHYFADGSTFNKNINIDLDNNSWLNFFEVLPKASVKYMINTTNSLYASISKGYKSGGFNTQMFSEILQQKLRAKFGLSELYTTDEIISYKPEYSWNYEVGGHFTNPSRTVVADLALFYIDCRDQQLTILPEGAVTGRMMTNAGHSRSYGAELSTTATLGQLRLTGSYGYTNAKFVEYSDDGIDYAGKYVPYAPQHTLYGAAIYSIPTKCKVMDKIEVEVNTNGAGAIYWNENNSLKQPLYALLGASLRFSAKSYSLAVWGRNLTDKNYDTFYFESMNCEFVQRARPMTFGATLNITL